MSTTKRTRGGRTASERAEDAARSAATAFEDLPAGEPPGCDIFLKDVAVLLRFMYGAGSEQRAEAAQEAYVGLLGRLRYWRRSYPQLAARPGLSSKELLTELSDLAFEISQRLDHHVSATGLSDDADDEGLVLATKAYRLLNDSSVSVFGQLLKLERAGV